MKYLLGLVLIFVYYLIGTLLTKALNLPMPSSIISMLLLFVSLTSGIVPARWVKDACTLLITVMPLFFIPASMGLMDHFHLLISESMPLLGATLVSSVTVLVVMSKVLDRLHKEAE
ncbi:CidA/LrgA family protein [Enterovibrio coralii]|uniref:Antiholin LrgA n=1 Tax=Enterovibrio coralii TaxID=294935 RepID=A0A135I963_9GAMM|nr:CidA/LrgA family protein [Enterovibrio coralii]KXF81990.1 antiholin LrgA [Enterovibrio coralii]